MEPLSQPYLAIGLLSLLGGVVACWWTRQPRRCAGVAAAAACGCFLLVVREVCAAGHGHLIDPWLPIFEADSLNAVLMACYAALTLLCVVLAPRRDAGGRAMAGMLLIALATQMAYAAADWSALVAGWWLSCVPFALGLFRVRRAGKTAASLLVASGVALSAGVAVLQSAGVEALSQGGSLALGLLLLAVVLRKGLFPLHAGVVQLFEHGPLLPVALLFNGHLGVLLIARAEATALPVSARHALDLLCLVAVATVVFASLRACAEKKPRRLLAFLCISQGSFMLAGLATANAAGITGALIHWLGVAVAATGLMCIVRVLEVRVSSAEEPMMAMGLAAQAPRLATLFLVCGLALVGLPGTVGYCGEELIFHGMRAAHPVAGIALLVATALNAITLLRLFNRLFLGVLPKEVMDVPDALPRERWPLTVCVVFLVFGGLLPSVVIGWRADAAQVIEEAGGKSGE